ncbi:sigma 54-interacting transcriptional regulator [Salibacteraceae bacterium]|nr:sigma 54-interacting transcriptional regulator [Salibacteraceae bacterium]
MSKPTTLGALKKDGYITKSVKEELRANLITAMQSGSEVFKGIIGYDDTVIPDIQRAILAKHNINLLGLRGQAKTSIARAMVDLLDEYIPAVEGSSLMEDPFNPILEETKNRIAELGDATPISWIHRSDRYTEKLATPDVSVADLIGDIDPIKAANKKLSYDDERAIHYGLIPRSNRGIFVINEIPDLQPRIQVALFNILQEGDIQIRGFKIRLPLDVQFIFTANPEDYTNRGSIITPLKDRIQSQIMTHYPVNMEDAKRITGDQAEVVEDQLERIHVPELLKDLIEEIVFEARKSEFVDQKSGVSTRLGISAYECLMAGVELRMIKTSEKTTNARISDLLSVIPAITGKIELVYEGEQEGAIQVAHSLIRNAIRSHYSTLYPSPEKLQSKNAHSPYHELVSWFSNNQFELGNQVSDEEYRSAFAKVSPLNDLISVYQPGLNAEMEALHCEFVLHALAEFSLISKKGIDGKTSFNDMLNAMLN